MTVSGAGAWSRKPGCYIIFTNGSRFSFFLGIFLSCIPFCALCCVLCSFMLAVIPRVPDKSISRYFNMSKQEAFSMAFFKKKKKEPTQYSLAENEFCHIISEESKDYHRKHYVVADERHYTLLYQNGRYEGQPTPFGGQIYPFSSTPTKMGSNRDKRQFMRSEIVMISKDFELEIKWGTGPSQRFHIEDPETKEPYFIGARGSFGVRINPTDAARCAYEFYSKLLSQYRQNEGFNTESLILRLQDRFLMKIEAAIENNIIRNKRSLSSYVGLGPNDLCRVSEEITPNVCDIFADYGLSISYVTLNGLIVTSAKEA